MSAPSRAQQKVAALLRQEADRLHFPALALGKVQALIEVAARLPDRQKGDQALADLVALMVALGQAGHSVAEGQLSLAFRSSTAALVRLAELRDRQQTNDTPLIRFSDRRQVQRAPQLGARAPAQSVLLKDLLSPARRLERPSVARSRSR